MITFESIQDYITSLHRKEFFRIMMAYFIAFTILVGFLLYRHNNLIADAQQKTKLLNKARQQVQTILTEYDTIKSKKAEVDEKLTKDKNFYLVKFYQDTIAAVRIASQNNPNLMSGSGPAGYTEESLQVNFTQITMQKLCEFLQALQATPRVTVKNLEISKGNVEKKINVSMLLATLKPTIDKISSTK
jgi:type II secretory pathway component PulM